MPKSLVLALVSVLFIAPSGYAQSQPPGQVFSNVGGLLIASNFNEWTIPQGTSPTNSQIQWTNNQTCMPTSGGTTFQAFSVGSPITIVDANTANSEVVTVTNYNSNTYGCQIQAVMQHTHYSYRIQSATAGLQEAINAAENLPYEVVVTPDWARMGGSTGLIVNAQGNYNVTILDQRSSVMVPYVWNGTNYVAQPFGGGGSAPCGTLGIVQLYGTNASLGCDPSVNVNTTTHSLNAPLVNGLTWPTGAPQVNGNCIIATTGLIGSWGNCVQPSNGGIDGTLAANMGATDTSFTINTGTYSGYGPGYLFVDTEWIYYSGISGNTVTVAPNGRGWFNSAATTHSVNAGFAGCVNCQDLPSNELPYAPIVGVVGDGTQVMGIGNPFPYNYGAQVYLQVGQGNQTLLVDKNGVLHQPATSSPVDLIRAHFSAYPYGHEFAAPLYIGVNSTEPITDTSYIPQINQQFTFSAAEGFTGGLAGPISTVQPPTIGAPFLYQSFAPGTTTYSYVCEGVDSDGNFIPGTTGSTQAAAALNGIATVQVFCPTSAGVVSYRVYRTAGNPNTGYLGSATQPYGYVVDTGATLDGTSPVGSNGDIPRVCNNNQQYCQLSGTSATPPVTCSTTTDSWEYHIKGATSSPYVKHCANGAWVTAY